MSSDSSKSNCPPAGWNDPPMFSYESRVQGSQATKLNLTKRVSFPLSSSESHQSSPSSPLSTGSPPLAGPPPICSLLPAGNGPPLSASPPSIPCLPTSDLPSNQAYNSIDLPETEMTFHNISDNLESQISNISKQNERVANDIRKKLKGLETMWNENKFNSDVKIKIMQLSKAVKIKDIKTGHELQKSLMVDHPSLCMTWIPAIRHLLNQLDSMDGLSSS